MTLVEKAKAFLGTRRHKYRQTFSTPVGKEVLADLAKFCRANETTVHAEDHMTYVLEGRREVWLRIAHHLNLSEEELWATYRKDTTHE